MVHQSACTERTYRWTIPFSTSVHCGIRHGSRATPPAGRPAPRPLLPTSHPPRSIPSDAVPFRESIRFTIEHGHGNEDAGRYRGVVFWYETR